MHRAVQGEHSACRAVAICWAVAGAATVAARKDASDVGAAHMAQWERIWAGEQLLVRP